MFVLCGFVAALKRCIALFTALGDISMWRAIAVALSPIH